MHIYSLALLSNFRTNFAAAQCGDMTFRYMVVSGGRDDEYPYAFGRECACPERESPLPPVSGRPPVA